MARHGDYLYRRNGNFYARIRVPQSLRAAYAQPDLRKSLDTTNYAEARFRVLEAVLSWKRDFLRIQAMLDACQVVAGSALLQGDGMMALDSAARECGLSPSTMLREAINRGVELRLEASGWLGYPIASEELEYDYDGALLVESATGHQDPVMIVGTLFLRRAALSLIDNGIFCDGLFFRDAARARAVVVDLPGIAVPVGSLLIEKADADAIRTSVKAGVTPLMLKLAAASRTRPGEAPSQPQHKHGAMRASELMAEFFKAKSDAWAPASKIEATGKCGVFIELMNDPTLSEIDGVIMLRYRERLRTLPADLYQTKRRLKTNALAELVTLTAAGALPTMSKNRADAYVAKIGECFAWGHTKGFLTNNPAAGAVERKKKTSRTQDDRLPFSDENLRLIFAAPWFQTGKGQKTLKGTYKDFQPHYYWLALLALYTGGRLTELSQLYTKDISRTDAGTWYVDFNLVGLNKIKDPDDLDDKRLKNVNSQRQVPLHPELVRLGLPEYAKALSDAGYVRLFPELRFDQVKGYGKQSGQWFNERFLGKALKIPRDGTQSFHCFRHTFITALKDLEPSPSEFTINQLSGHERGQTMSAKRYAKDAGPDTLRVHVDLLKFDIPPVVAFGVSEGIEAVKDALKRKERAAHSGSRNV